MSRLFYSSGYRNKVTLTILLKLILLNNLL